MAGLGLAAHGSDHCVVTPGWYESQPAITAPTDEDKELSGEAVERQDVAHERAQPVVSSTRSTDSVARYTFMPAAGGTWTVEEYGKPPYAYPTGLQTPENLPNLTGGLLKRGYSKADVAKIWGGNWLRVMTAVWG